MRNKILILLWVLAVSYACESDKKEIKKEVEKEPITKTKVLFITADDQESADQFLAFNMSKVCDYTKIEFQTITTSEFNINGKVSKELKLLVIPHSELLNKKAIASVTSFVNNGGTLFVPNITYDIRLSKLIGLKRGLNFEYLSVGQASGIQINKPLIPGYHSKVLNESFRHLGLSKENFTDKVTVFGTAIDKAEYPIFTQNKFGKGTTIYYNTDFEYPKKERGLLFTPIAIAMQGIPYPVANVSTVFLDDFPSPVYDNIAEPIKTEFGLSNADYVKDIWWPDMAHLADSLQLKYTAVTVFDYGTNIKPPYLFTEWDRMKVQNGSTTLPIPEYLSKEVVRKGHELGFHGYNHVSLLQQDWSNNSDLMTAGVMNAAKKWKVSGIGKLPVSYIPPTNLIDSVGVNALVKGMPSLQYMCSLYLGDVKEGGDREYDAEPYNKQLFGYPRVSSGFYVSKEVAYNIFSTYLYTGIWSHFVHPDDVYQIPGEQTLGEHGDFDYRNSLGMNWKTYDTQKNQNGLLQEFAGFLKKFKSEFPYQRFKTVENAGPIVKRWRTSTPTINITKSTIKVISEPDNPQQYWRVYVENSHTHLYDAQLKLGKVNYQKIAYLDGYLYMLKAKDGVLELPNTIEWQKNSPSTDMSDKESIVNSVADLVEENELKQATDLLETYFKSQKNIDSQLFDLYVKYMSWQDRGMAAWDFLWENAQTTKSMEYVTLANQLNKKISYPTDKYYSKWYQYQLFLQPNNISLLREKLNNTTNKKDQRALHLRIMQLKFNQQDQADYWVYLLDDNEDQFIEAVANQNICNNKYLSERYTDIAWLFANKKMYKEALEVSECATIDNETMFDWYIADNNLPLAKQISYDAYLVYLLENNHDLFLKEVESLNAKDNKKLKNYATEISWLYADKNNYKEAYNWAQYSSEIPLIDQFEWLKKIKNIDEIKSKYATYLNSKAQVDKDLLARIKSQKVSVANTNNPAQLEIENNRLKAYNQAYFDTQKEEIDLALFMSNMYLDENNFIAAWRIVNKMPEGGDKEERRKYLNEYVQYQDLAIQKELAKTDGELFYSENLAYLKKKIAHTQQNFGEWESILALDRTNVTSLQNKLSVTLIGKKSYQHKIALTNTNVYKVSDDNLGSFDQDLSLNRSHNLFGVSYVFNKHNFDDVWNYAAGGGVSADQEKVLFNVLGTLSYSKDNLFLNSEFDYGTPQTSVAYSLELYRARLVTYAEKVLNNKHQISLSAEGELFSDSNQQATLIAKYYRNFKIKNSTVLSPLVETAYATANKNIISGLPYSLLTNRFYYGGGARVEYHTSEDFILDKFNFFVEPAFFGDTFFDTFFRVNSEMNYEFREHSFVNFSLEYFSQEGFYSNTFSLGFKHIF
ncbi:DUF2194 domain-containing protein [Wenyingzhuangia sp. IMCC45533]